MRTQGNAGTVIVIRSSKLLALLAVLLSLAIAVGTLASPGDRSSPPASDGPQGERGFLQALEDVPASLSGALDHMASWISASQTSAHPGIRPYT